MCRVMTADFKHKIEALQRALNIHGGDLTINASGVYLSKEGLTCDTPRRAAKILADAYQKYFDEGGT